MENLHSIIDYTLFLCPQQWSNYLWRNNDTACGFHCHYILLKHCQVKVGMIDGGSQHVHMNWPQQMRNYCRAMREKYSNIGIQECQLAKRMKLSVSVCLHVYLREYICIQRAAHIKRVGEWFQGYDTFTFRRGHIWASLKTNIYLFIDKIKSSQAGKQKQGGRGKPENGEDMYSPVTCFLHIEPFWSQSQCDAMGHDGLWLHLCLTGNHLWPFAKAFGS